MMQPSTSSLLHDSYDAVVVGAGHNGLTTATYLARAGLRTLLVEARSEVGGTAASDTFAGCRVNICNCDHLAVRTNPLIEELQLHKHGLEYIDIEPAQINGSWHSDNWWPSFHDLERTCEALSRVLPHEVNNYRRYVADALPVISLILDNANDIPSRRKLLSNTARRRGRGVTRLLQWSRSSAAEVLESYFTSPEIIGPALVEGPTVWGVSPHTPHTGLGAITLAMRHAAQVGRPVGGSGALPNALLSAYESFGGHLLLASPVSAILCEDQLLYGIELTDGRVIRSSTVISACNPHDTFVKWLKGAPSSANTFIERWRTTPQSQGYESKIDAIFHGDIQYKALQHDRYQDVLTHNEGCTFVIAPNTQELHEGHMKMAAGQILARPAFLANTPTLTDSTLAPPGTNILSLEALFTPYNFVDGWESRAEPSRWLSLFDTLLTEPLAPRISSWRVKTPAHYETEFFLPQGHATSFAGGPMSIFFSQQPELSRYTTPIKNLYITGAATFPGAGVWGSSGRNAAQVVLRSL